MSRSLPYQISCVRHAIAAAELNDEVRAGAEAGLETLEWLERNVEVIREFHRVMTKHRAVIDVLKAFPGSQIQHPDPT